MKEELGVVPNLEGIKANHLKKSLVSKEEFQSLLKTSYIPLQNLILDNFAFILEHLELIYLWLNSKEFKEKYENINHPYPPLLNPDILNELLNLEDEQDKETLRIKLKELSNTQHTNALSDTIKAYAKAGLDYRLIPAEKAWEMNLPLPKNYKFLFWGSHGVGNTGIHTFLYQSGFTVYSCLTDEGSKATYLYQYKGVISHKKGENIYLSLIDYFNATHYDEDGDKLGSLYPDTPTLHQTRDPISKLKTHTTMKRRGRNYKINVNVDDDVKEIVKNRVGYWGGRGIINNPSFIGSLSIIESKYEIYHDFLLKKRLKNIKDIIIIDSADIIGEKGEKTMLRLAKEFNFEIPDFERIRKIFSLRIAEYIPIFPLYVDCNEYLKCFICLTKFQLMDKEHINVNSYFGFKDEEFLACVHKDKLEIFRQNVSKIHLCKDKLQKIALELEKLKEKAYFKRDRVKEDKLLDYLKAHPNIAKKFKKVLDEKHLPFIKEQRPDIVASWKYYQEFEKMCGEMKEG
ncbi:DUF2972 domain-containing protein [Campylobacter helveticus]|uniref:DUF2972 domain-containing protein n=1 Tax=Campylobacter helveticus TaxID=28898 RepID=UPI0022EA5222|nr:DUF2972 domain-containing protein [Campylobacter helveticus]